MTRERIRISIDSEIMKNIQERANQSSRSIAEEIEIAMLESPKEHKEKMSALLVIARKNERELRIIKGMLNSMFVAMASLTDAEYVNPETKKHPIITGAEKEELYRLREESAKRARMKELES